MADDSSQNNVRIALISAVSAVLVAVVGGYFALRGSEQPQTPGPAVTAEASATGVIHMVPGYDFVWIYGSPVANPAANRIGQISTGQQVEIVCTVQGPPAHGPGGNSTVWNRIRFNDGYGFISDANVDTGSNLPVAPNCK